MTAPAKTVFAVDDDTSFLTSLERLLRSAGYAVECFSSAAEFLARRPPEAPGCVLADLRMPGMDGMALQAVLAASGNPLPIIFLSGQGDIPTTVEAMRHGAEDFLAKTASKDELLAAVERAHLRDARERAARTNALALHERFEKLTPREREVLVHVLRGRLNKQIAGDLGIDERSVKRHRTSLMHKAKVRSVAELALLAASVGLDSVTTTPGDL